MANILDLPAEVLFKIFLHESLSRSDIARVARICEMTNAIVTADLYRHIEFPPYRALASIPQPSMEEVEARFSRFNFALTSLLSTLATREDLANMVTTLRLEVNLASPYLNTCSLMETQTNFTELTFGPRALTASEVVQGLRNLKSLELNNFWSKTLLRSSFFMPSLETAVVRRNYGDVKTIFQLMVQPNIQEVTIEPSSRFILMPPSAIPTSIVSHLKLVTPWGGTIELRTLVQMTKNLKSLKLVRTLEQCWAPIVAGQQGCRCGTTAPGPSSEDISDVLSLVTHSLEVLVMTNSHKFPPPVLESSRLSSLNDFKTLKELKIGAAMILGTRACPAVHTEDPPEDITLPCRRFADQLPPNLQKLHLEIAREQLDRDERYCEDIIDSMVNNKKQLPELTSLIVQEVQPLYTSACRCEGPAFCYNARDEVNSSSPAKAILDLQQKCSKVGTELTYISQRGLAPACARTLFIAGKEPQALSVADYHTITTPWTDIDLKL